MLAQRLTRLTLGLALALAIAGCSRTQVEESAIEGERQPIRAPHVVLSAPYDTVAPGGTLQFSADGGLAPYSYYVIAGQGWIDQSTGQYSAPSIPGFAVIGVSDSLGDDDVLSITIQNWGSSVTIAPATRSLTVTQQITFTPSGGTAPYGFSIVSGGGTLAGTTFTAPDNPGTTVLLVTDAAGMSVTATLSIQAAVALTLSPTSANMLTGANRTFTAAGGIPPYSYYVSSGGGSFNGNRYTAGWAPGTAQVAVIDSRGTIATANVSIQASYQTGHLSRSFPLRVDHYTAFSYDGRASTPNFTFWGHGPNSGPDDVARNCDTRIPNLCGYTVYLSNLATFPVGVSYRGSIDMTGRSGERQELSFCIPPGETTVAYIRWDVGAGFTAWRNFTSSGKVLFGGRSALTAFQTTDNSSGTGTTNVVFDGYYSGDLDCLDFEGQPWVEVSP
ncbi:MAG TPA: hypothetical protein VM598_07190 [Bdellovibrionota bacterium]|nr:hypothetical protein [Bdellovibrionota bacterium]